ncbi:hypothetical protein [Proteiniborus sp. MB09-C3]|uniref:hypothetical protein n=1 Tax=Proteiniborus sp. MB09-C3 TaxID=3050072 RepID=UPI002555D839|nr:hypothetical protein [Proteiniborus sp. MB09-C3]WIV10952.1 hypothetical protein QO263_12400 [Proteiniborus sp. MB09-C3]
MKDFKRILNKIETVVLVLSIIGVFFLVMQLGFIKNMEMPTFYDDYEHIADEPVKNKEAGYVVLKRNSDKFNSIFVTVNGKGKYKFDKKNELMLKVFDGDIIELDSTMYDEEIEIKIKVVGISKNINKPELNEVLTTEGSIKTFLQVKID